MGAFSLIVVINLLNRNVLYSSIINLNEMEKRIALECGNIEKSEVTVLNLDHCKTTGVCGLTEEFVALETLSLINNGLTSLEGFPPLLKLRKLELADNFLSGGFEILESCPNLQRINLSGNKIKDVECLRPLSKLSNLVAIDLYCNEITSSEAFPDNVKEILPNVQSFCEDELEGLSSDDDDDEDQDDEYEDEEGDSEGDEVIRPLEANGLGSSSGGKSGPSVNGVAEGQDDLDEEEEDDEVDSDDLDEEDEAGELDDEITGKTGVADDQDGEEGQSDFDDDEEDKSEGDDEDDDEEGAAGEDGPGLAYLYGKDLNDDDDNDVEYRTSTSSRKLANGSKEGIEDAELGPTPSKQKKVDSSTAVDNEDHQDEES